MRLHNSTLNIPIRKRSQGDGSWAVSYADFLMVLLSFFIVFFSLDPKTVLNRILLNAKIGQSGQIGHAEVNSGLGNSEESSLATLSKRIPNAKLNKNAIQPRIEIEFHDNLYEPGKYESPKAAFVAVIEALKPVENEISITILGHSDDVPFQRARPVINTSNLTLAGIRAAYASVYLQEQLPQAEVATLASNSGTRKTRSLTLYIQERQRGGP